MNKDEIKKQNILLLQEYVKEAKSRAEYSIKRFDLLVISLSSGGVVLALNLYKSFESNTNFNTDFLSYSWLFFTVAIISNLLSQTTGLLANKYDIKATEEIIESLENDTETKANCYDCYKNIFNITTIILNISSFIGLTIAIILLTIFIN